MKRSIKKIMRSNNAKFSLRQVTTNAEWFHFHRIRKRELFDKYMKNIVYDPNHPSIRSTNITNYIFYKKDRIIGTVSTDKLDAKRMALRFLAIDIRYKNKGHGSTLLDMIEAIIKKQGYKLILLHANSPAYTFYKKNRYIEMEFDEGPLLDPTWIDMGKIIK